MMEPPYDGEFINPHLRGNPDHRRVFGQIGAHLDPVTSHHKPRSRNNRKTAVTNHAGTRCQQNAHSAPRLRARLAVKENARPPTGLRYGCSTGHDSVATARGELISFSAPCPFPSVPLFPASGMRESRNTRATDDGAGLQKVTCHAPARQALSAALRCARRAFV